MKFYKIVSEDKEEMVAIFMDLQSGDYSTDDWIVIAKNICGELKHDRWLVFKISQVEFETYQAFGIQEIKP